MFEDESLDYKKQTNIHQFNEVSNFLNKIVTESDVKNNTGYRKQIELFYANIGNFTYLYDELFFKNSIYYSKAIDDPIDRFQLHLYEFSCCLYRCMKKTPDFNIEDSGMVFTGLGKLCDWSVLKLQFDSVLSHIMTTGMSNESLTYFNVTGSVFGGLWDGTYIWNAEEIMKSDAAAETKTNLLRAELSRLFIRKGSKLTSDAIMVYNPVWEKEQIVWDVKDVI